MTARNTVGAPLFDSMLQTGEVYSSNPALATIPRTLAGQARLLLEMADPGNDNNGDRPCAPYNARGLIGEDHTGAGFGKPLRHTFYAYGGPSDLSYLQGSGNADYLCVPFLYYAVAASTTGPGITVRWPSRVFVPACWPGGAYESATVNAAIYCSHKTGGMTVDVSHVLYNETLVSGGPYDLGFTANMSDSTFYTGSATIPVLPGQWNVIRSELSSGSVTNASGGEESLRLICCSLSFSQGV